MDYKKNKEILLKLLLSQTSDEIEKIVNTESFFKNCEWIPYGGRSNNVGTIEGQMRDADNALMEKITNSIDAILMRRCYEEGIDPRDKEKAPKSMAEAVERFFGGKEKIREKRSEFAKEWIRLIAEGKKDRPTITVIDKGEGQQPNDIKETILSLGRDIKEKIPFVYGTYNQGGSSPLGYAGKQGSYDFNYLQLVLCRRADTIKDKIRTKNYNHYGFTIIRRRFDYSALKYTYEYFVEKETENIFSFPQNEVIKFNDYDFSEGCLIKLYDYQLPERGNIVFRGLNEFIEKKLPDSPLPIYLKELREYKGGVDYTIFGLKEKLLRKSEILRDSYPQKLPIDLGEIGKREIEVFILKHKTQIGEDLSSYLEQSEKIFFLKDGLVLHTENTAWLRNECDLIDLSPYFFAFIDISNINPPIAQMLHSGREKFKNNVTTKLAIERLEIFISNEMFKELDREYGRLSFGSDSSIKDDDLRRDLVKDFETQPELKELFELGEDIPVKEEKGEGDKEPPPYEGTYLPKKFELLGLDPREIEENSYCKIAFDTGGDEKLFDRREDRGEYDWGKSSKFQIALISYKRGKLTFRVDPNKDTKAPLEEALLFFLRVPSKNIEFSKSVTVVVKEKKQYMGQQFPSFFEPTKKLLRIPLGSTRKLNFNTDVENDYFERKVSPGTLKIDQHDHLNFSKPKLEDGLLEIKIKYMGDKIQKINDIKITINDADHNFELITSVEIIPPENGFQFNLPKPIRVRREDWNNDTPAWDENSVARIPSWNELKMIKINIDSKPFDELNKLSVADREAARNLLIKQIYINSVWMFLEFKELHLTPLSNNEGKIKYPDPRDEIFEKGIRATTKITIQNIKKLLR
jgi:hypothetical protein